MDLQALLYLLGIVSCVHARHFGFASYYGDHMVLQKGPERSVLWGYGTSDLQVTLTVTGKESNQTHKTSVHDGVWKVTLDAVKPGGPYNVTVMQSDRNNASVTLQDVLFGDVWLCGGQSNMVFTVSQIINATEELAHASNYPNVRIFMASLDQSTAELRDLGRVEVPWSVPTKQLLGGGDFTHFSAVCWLFGRYLYDVLGYPVGLVESCWGGTPVEAWSSTRVIQKCGLADGLYYSSWKNSLLWNAMIHPLLNMTLKGAIWYQGEQNTVYNQDRYNCTFPAMIEDWRMAFHHGSDGQTAVDFPFGFVQISTYLKGSQDDAYPNLRWHQSADYGYAPNPRMKKTFMALALDLPDEASPWGSIHPRYKRDVAFRLTLGARAVAYGEENISFQGPFPSHVQLSNNQLNVTYDQPVIVRTSTAVFEVCCSVDRKPCAPMSQWMPAEIVSFSGRSIQVNVSMCQKTISSLRYAWRDWPCDFKACAVYSADGVLPAPPFIYACLR